MFKALLLLMAASVAPAAAQEREMVINGTAGALAGTLVGAEGGEAALILPGSGPTDRNGNQLSPPLLTNSYRLLAEGLAAQGLPTLRIDKRGIGESEGDANAVSFAAYREDTAAWIDALQNETGAACVWLIGHSEGGLIALASADLPDLCGIILLAAPGRPLGPILVEQIAANPLFGQYADALEVVLEDLAAGRQLDLSGLPPGLAALFRPETRDYLTELITTDPAELVENVDLPLLAITGDADIQVPADEHFPLVAANPGVQALTLAGLTHTLKQVAPGDTAASLVTYADPRLPLHEDLVPAILAFIEEH